jgi:hypothetical protein
METKTGRDIKQFGELLESVGAVIQSFAIVVDPVIAWHEEIKHRERCARVLKIKAWTLGLTYNERQRLNKLTIYE